MSNVCALYHIVFCTKKRLNTLPLNAIGHLYRFIGALTRTNKCFLVNIGGMSNHVHMLIDLHQDVALSSLIRELKAKSSQFLSNHKEFPNYQGWAKGYYAATLSYSHKTAVDEYIINQHNHHGCVSFDDELERLVRINGMTMRTDDYE